MPALYKRKKKWRLPEQADSMDYMDEEQSGESAWKAYYATLAALADKVTEVLDDQAERGQVLKFSEAEARSLYTNLVVERLSVPTAKTTESSLPGVLFDGTNGRTRIRDQERSPTATNLKRAMREKARVGERTFALTADVSEAQRQVPIAECDWCMQGCQVQPGVFSLRQQGWGPSAWPLLPATGLELRRPWAASAQYLSVRTGAHMAHAGGGRLSSTVRLLRLVCDLQCSSLVE